MLLPGGLSLALLLAEEVPVRGAVHHGGVPTAVRMDEKNHGGKMRDPANPKMFYSLLLSIFLYVIFRSIWRGFTRKKIMDKNKDNVAGIPPYSY